ncbi:unnamed protein product [Malus baccata var. baccata]
MKLICTVWYVKRDGTEWDEVLCPTFGAPKMGGTSCSTGRILGEFSFCLTPWNDSFYISGIQNYNLYVFFFFLLVSIKGYFCSVSVPSRSVPSRFVPSRPICIPNDT